MATGPEGFEPPTTWLKARRSTELSYEPTCIQMYSVITMQENYINILTVPFNPTNVINPLLQTSR